MTLLSVYIDGTQYTTNRIFNLYFKDKMNEVGRFEFDIHSVTSDDLTRICVNAVLFIQVHDITRFYGFIKKIQYNKSRLTYHIEGESLGGILGTKRTQDPVVMEMSSGMTKTYTKYVAAEIIFNQCGFATSGTSGWQITGTNGCQHFAYYIENRSAIDHVIQLAKIANMDWKCYLA